MIGLDSFSRQVFTYFGPYFDLYQSLNRLPIWNSQNCSMFPLAFVAGWLQGHWWGFISRNYVVWLIFFLMNVFIALKGSHLWFLLEQLVHFPTRETNTLDLILRSSHSHKKETSKGGVFISERRFWVDEERCVWLCKRYVPRWLLG